MHHFCLLKSLEVTPYFCEGNYCTNLILFFVWFVSSFQQFYSKSTFILPEGMSFVSEFHSFLLLSCGMNTFFWSIIKTTCWGLGSRELLGGHIVINHIFSNSQQRQKILRQIKAVGVFHVYRKYFPTLFLHSFCFLFIFGENICLCFPQWCLTCNSFVSDFLSHQYRHVPHRGDLVFRFISLPVKWKLKL